MIPDLAGGGAEKVLVNLVNNMDRSKFDITVKTIFDVGVNRERLLPHIRREYCIKKQFRGNTRFFTLFQPEFLFKRFIKEHYDIIVSYLDGSAARIVSGCTDTQTKLVSWIHCVMDTRESAAVSFRNYEEAKDCYSRFNQTVCVSQASKESFCRVLDFKKPITVLYNTNETDEIIKKSEESIPDFPSDGSGFTICSIGKVTPVKGYDRLARIHARLLQDGIYHRMVVIGDGSERQKIQAYVDNNGLHDSFVFLGFKENPYPYLKKSDLFVCSSLSEGFSTSVTESLILGVPVVTTLCSGMTEMLGEHNEYGIVTENNEDALYQGIKTMLTTPGLPEHYSRQAKARGKEFSIEQTVTAVEKMLEGLL